MLPMSSGFEAPRCDNFVARFVLPAQVDSRLITEVDLMVKTNLAAIERERDRVLFRREEVIIVSL